MILEDGHVGLADLDCDGSVDTVRVEWIYKQGIPYAQTSVVGRELSGRSSGQTDQLPQLVSFADLNADGLRDIVVMYLDDSAVIGEVELVRRDGLRFPVADPALDWEHMDYVWPGDLSGSRDCIAPITPRVERAPDGGWVLSVAFGEAMTVAECLNPPRRRIRIVGDTLKAAG